tara:strand:- start:11 stop:268 length:258 start_codon:yes stop_codon:yes gene_type:complete
MADNTRKYIVELFKIVSTNSILVVTNQGKLKRLYCPFLVVCKVNVPSLTKGCEYEVESVKMTLKLEEVFVIGGNAYFIWCFSIVA